MKHRYEYYFIMLSKDRRPQTIISYLMPNSKYVVGRCRDPPTSEREKMNFRP
jgi:hypothetical protein